jgi:parallel beta helix pectate lyase-like protein
MKLSRVLVLAAFVLGMASLSYGQATRTWVSGVGDDANPCSRTAPCKTFAGAISKTAAGGEIDTLDPGGFGAVTITKSMTIDGTAGLGGLVATGGISAIIVNAGASDRVFLRHLDINGGITGLNGIRIISAANVVIDGCTIYGFRASSSARGVLINPSSAQVGVEIFDSIIRHISGMGIESIPSGTGKVDLTLDNTRIVDNDHSAIDLDNNTYAEIKHSLLAQNAFGGLYVERSTCEANVYQTVISKNANGLYVGDSGGGVVRLFNSSVVNNTTNGIVILAGTVATHGNNAIIGNAGTQATNLPAGQQ